jgi:hypothetical protein
LVAARSSGRGDPTTALELASTRVELIRSGDRLGFELQYQSQSSGPTSFAAAALASQAKKISMTSIGLWVARATARQTQSIQLNTMSGPRHR